ncbi:MAG: YkgJ family cysteine cluster protein [Desulfobaccales bacterium]
MDHADKSPVFHCRQCGDCCAGRGGIHVRPQEVEAMAAHLSMPVAEFSRRFVEASATGPRLMVANEVCVFLLEGNNCRVHLVKPFICRQWPFLPALLVEADELKYAKGACPGIDPSCSHEDFVAAALSGGHKPAEP